MAFTNGSSLMDGNLLYHVMAGLSCCPQPYLNLDYGYMSGLNHHWVSHPGEEVKPNTCTNL